MSTVKLRQDALKIFQAALAAADAKEATRRFLSVRSNCLHIGEQSLPLTNFERIFVIGFGKAAASMAVAVESILGDLLTGGVVIVKYGHLEPLAKVQLHQAGHPVPDESGGKATQEVIRLAKQATEKDLVICLISGGGSALFTLPVDGVSLLDKQNITRKLLACGASINEINTVRKHISKVKGGQLARLIAPATCVTLALSDVVGDSPDVIASGPTAPDSSTFDDVEAVFHKYELAGQLPEAIAQHIAKRALETPKPGDPAFRNNLFQIIAGNYQALKVAKETALKLTYNTLLLSSSITGEAREIAGAHAAMARQISSTDEPIKRPACLISGGETTVTVRGNGKGGRNQEFCLAAAQEIAGLENVVVFSAGTDGEDGPTDAAGAMVDGTTIDRARRQGLDSEDYLARNDSYNFFDKLGELVKTGSTKTNVIDLRLVIVGVSK